MSDYIVHASGAGNQVRIFAASTRDLVEKAREIHNTSPVATAALGRLLTAGAMMGSMMGAMTALPPPRVPSRPQTMMDTTTRAILPLVWVFTPMRLTIQ